MGKLTTGNQVADMSRAEYVGVSPVDYTGRVIEEHPDERLCIGGQVVSSDTWGKEFSRLIDDFPINTPRDVD